MERADPEVAVIVPFQKVEWHLADLKAESKSHLYIYTVITLFMLLIQNTEHWSEHMHAFQINYNCCQNIHELLLNEYLWHG